MGAMDAASDSDVTLLIERWRVGDREAGELMFSRLYNELRLIARRQLRQERDGHTLQATALVNEALMRLLGEQAADWQNREHVVALAAQAMRRVLVDHARRRLADKRPDPFARVSLSAAEHMANSETVDILALDRALEALAEIEPRQARIVELRYFTGLTSEQVAQSLAVSLATINREWRVARAWLRVALQEQG
ncbi:MAG: ECF-type sigma factor [Tahibacter sp.]